MRQERLMLDTLSQAGGAMAFRTAPASSAFSVAIYMHDLSGGGVERQTLSLARELRANGLAVSLVLHQARGELRDIVPLDIRVVDLGSRRTLEDIPLLARFLRQEQPDVLLANVDHNNVAAVLGNLWAGMQTEVIICQHNSISKEYSAKLRWSYRLIPATYRLLAPFIRRAVAVSQGLADELQTMAHISHQKVSVINNPVIDSDFQRRADEPVTHPWLSETGRAVFVTAGRLVDVKDHDTLLRALAIHRTRQPSRLLILGTGPLRERLGSLVNELGLHEAVDFLGFQENPLPYFRAADAVVLSSYSEGFGNVLVESMGCGTPVISTDCPHGPAEILDHGRYGMLVPPRSPEALAKAMDHVGDLRRHWPPVALKARAAEYTISACAAHYVRLFQSLALERASRQASWRGMASGTLPPRIG